MTNADKCFEHFVYNNWKYNKTDKLRYNQNSEYFEYKGSPIGRVDTIYLEARDVWYTYIVLPLQTYASDKDYGKQVKALYKSAQKYGYEVMFVNELDLGFGLMYDYYVKPEYMYKRLARLQKITDNNQVVSISYYTHYLDGNYNVETFYFDSFDNMHRYIQCRPFEDYTIVCTCAPDYGELMIALRVGAISLWYALPSQEKSEFVLCLLDEINAGITKNSNDKKLKVYYLPDKSIKEKRK